MDGVEGGELRIVTDQPQSTIVCLVALAAKKVPMLLKLLNAISLFFHHDLQASCSNPLRFPTHCSGTEKRTYAPIVANHMSHREPFKTQPLEGKQGLLILLRNCFCCDNRCFFNQGKQPTSKIYYYLLKKEVFVLPIQKQKNVTNNSPQIQK